MKYDLKRMHSQFGKSFKAEIKRDLFFWSFNCFSFGFIFGIIFVLILHYTTGCGFASC